MADLDPFRLRVLTDLAKFEGKIFAKVWDLLRQFATRARRALFGGTETPKAPDPLDLFAVADWWGGHLDDVMVEVVETFDFAAHDLLDELPDGAARAAEFARQARNRLVGVPDRVFADVRRQTLKATTEGWSIDELAREIGQVLADAGHERWQHRAVTIARTEAIAAYNGGKFAAFTSIAKQTGEPWEKLWLATHDHRTRWSHTKRGGGDGQRVPLMSPFHLDGGTVMYPGDPTGPADEIINCRCSILLVSPGEQPDLSDRHYRGSR